MAHIPKPVRKKIKAAQASVTRAKEKITPENREHHKSEIRAMVKDERIRAHGFYAGKKKEVLKKHKHKGK